MATFATDTFTGTDGTDLLSHESDSGGTWAKVTGNPGTFLLAGNAAANTATTTLAAYRLSGSPASADYDVQADITFSNYSNSNVGVTGRTSSTDNTYYWATWTGNLKWELYKCV